MSKRLGAFIALLLVAAGLAASAATASRSLKVGLLDDAAALYSDPRRNYPIFKQLRTQVLRVTLYWGGRTGVAERRPSDPSDPSDPAYDWAAYDRTAHYAWAYGIELVFTIFGTPGWENGGKGLNRAPSNAADLRSFANAAAKRFSGRYRGDDDRIIPPVHLWTAWNEPNNPLGLQPQYRRVGGRYVIQSAIDYAKICKAVYDGVHATRLPKQKVACGVTSPRGNNQPRSSRPAVTPIVFLRALKQAGLRRFDVYAHHPYYGRRGESPTYRPSAKTAVTLGNIDVLIKELTKLYGPKRLWITEYGYQTNPPDRFFGVSYAKQAAYLKQAHAIARKNPRIDMLVWFLLRDERGTDGWQSGLMTYHGVKKPAFDVFRKLPH